MDSCEYLFYLCVCLHLLIKSTVLIATTGGVLCTMRMFILLLRPVAVAAREVKQRKNIFLRSFCREKAGEAEAAQSQPISRIGPLCRLSMVNPVQSASLVV